MPTNFIDEINHLASKNGYCVVLCQHHYSEEEELKIINLLCKQNVAGVIWECVSQDSLKYKDLFNKIPIYTINSFEKNNIHNYYIDYIELGNYATKYLINNKHNKIACIVRKDNEISKNFIEGYKKALYENQINYNPQYIKLLESPKEIDSMFLFNITGIVCLDESIASSVYKQAFEYGYKIPDDLSVIALGEPQTATLMIPKLTTVKRGYKELAYYVTQKLLNQIEKREQNEIEFKNIPEIMLGESVGNSINSKRKKFIVVGSINNDMFMKVRETPTTGKTILAQNCVTFSGGKGANQAIGISRLGGEAYLIGRIGNDYDGKMLRDILNKEGVNINGVSTDFSSTTGKAYICVQDNGESSIIVYAGVNDKLSWQDIKQNQHVFYGAEFCLLQTEISTETVEYAANVAKKNNVKVILKPSAAQNISDHLLSCVDILIPNESEFDSICKDQHSIKERAQYFLDKGVGNIIITMGHKGCYLKNASEFIYFSAADFVPVDTTGAADAFIATLAVYLSEGYNLRQAIKYATYAAGISVTKQGVQPALIDRATLEMYSDDIDIKIVEETID